MKRILSATLLVFLIILLVSGCDGRNPTSTSTSLIISTNLDTLHIGSSTNSCNIRAAITRDGEAIEGAQVNFSTNFGKIFVSGNSNIYGVAETTFWYDGNETGVATIRASYSGAEDQLQIQIVDDLPFLLNIWADPDTIYLGSGQYSTDVHARLTDRDGVAISNQNLYFDSSGGYVTPNGMTNASGYAEAVYIHSGNVEDEIEILVTYQGVTAVNFIQIYQLDIINLEVWADPDTVYVGTSANSAEIYAELTDAFNNPIVDEQISFTTNIGSILGFADTNSNGIANSTFWYNERPDITAVITAEYLGITKTVNVIILEDQAQIVFLEADPLIIYADNNVETYSLITTRVLDSAGSPAEGLLVTFVTTIGYMQQPYAETDANGYATSRLQDNGIYGVATVYVSCENDQSQIDVHILPQ